MHWWRLQRRKQSRSHLLGTGTPTNPAHTRHRYVQYRAVLTSPTHRAIVVLEAVTLAFVPAEE